MRKYFGALVAILSLSGCFGMGAMYGIGVEDDVIKTASFENNCPKDQVKVVNSETIGMANRLFNVDVCGKQIQYRQTGTVFHRADKPIL